MEFSQETVDKIAANAQRLPFVCKKCTIGLINGKGGVSYL